MRLHKPLPGAAFGEAVESRLRPTAVLCQSQRWRIWKVSQGLLCYGESAGASALYVSSLQK